MFWFDICNFVAWKVKNHSKDFTDELTAET